MSNHRFEKNRHYSRREIYEILGGQLQDFLPTQNNIVIYGCFDVKAGPDVPDVLLASDGPRIYKSACLFCEQKAYVPVFVMENGIRTYRGEYRVKRCSESAEEIARQCKRSGRTNIKRVLFLEEKEQS